MSPNQKKKILLNISKLSTVSIKKIQVFVIIQKSTALKIILTTPLNLSKNIFTYFFVYTATKCRKIMLF